MTGRRGLLVCATLACLLAAGGGCKTRKGFILDCGLKFEFNRVPWRTGPDGQYEVDGPDCLTCGNHGGSPGCTGGAGPRCAGDGCPPAPLPGDCGLPGERPHPHSRFNPLPMHDVLHGPAPMPPPYLPEAGGVIREEALPEAVLPPAKPPQPVPKDAGEKSTRIPALRSPQPFQLEEQDQEEDETPNEERSIVRVQASSPSPAVGRPAPAPAAAPSAARGQSTSWMFAPSAARGRVN